MHNNLPGESNRVENFPAQSQMAIALVFLVMPATVFVLIYSAPVDVLNQWAWSRSLCDEVLSVFPAVERKSIHSTFPQVRQFGRCLVVASMPIQIFVYLIAFAMKAKDICLRVKLRQDMNWLRNIALASIGLVFSFNEGLLSEPEAPLSKAGRLMETQRFSAAFTDSGLLVVVPICFALIVISAIGIFIKFLNRED